MTKRFQLAYNAIVDGYINGTIKQGDASACACAHIVASAQGIGLQNLLDIQKGYNERVFNPTLVTFLQSNEDFFKWISASPRGTLFQYFPTEEADKFVLDVTGYTPEEFIRVENVFDYSGKYDPSLSEEENTFIRICDTIDVLLELDNIENKDELREGFKQGRKLQLTA